MSEAATVTHADRLEIARTLWTGKLVKYIDPVRVEHDALITQVWNIDEEGMPNYINLVFVVDDVVKHDNYGRQIDRATSVPILSDATAAGRCFKHV